MYTLDMLFTQPKRCLQTEHKKKTPVLEIKQCNPPTQHTSKLNPSLSDTYLYNMHEVRNPVCCTYLTQLHPSVQKCLFTANHDKEEKNITDATR